MQDKSARFGTVLLAKDEDEFWAQFPSHVHFFKLKTKASFKVHELCDRRLIKKIDKLIEPLLGPHGYKDELWFENLELYGDGVRQLSFRWSDVSRSLLVRLQKLLIREHARFCILCKFHTKRMEKGDLVGLLALFRGKALATHGFSKALQRKRV